MSSPLSTSMEAIPDRFDDVWNEPPPPSIEDYLAKGDPERKKGKATAYICARLNRKFTLSPFIPGASVPR